MVLGGIFVLVYKLAVYGLNVELAGLVEVYGGVEFLDYLAFYLLDGHVGLVPVALVLNYRNALGGLEGGKLVGSVEEQSVRAEGIVLTLLFDELLVKREVGVEGGEAEPEE